ncbi:MAG: TetR/AcrR family transcriptional regulator [Ignavibacteriaceae bacterium]|nr:TetR/AcrR family transcriptional regulator [Ignavibacteriaceae bacterium]
MRVKEGNKEADILDAAIKVFAKSGFHNAKIYTIAETAGIATGSVYLYFRNKEAVLNKIFENLWGQLYKEISELNQRSDLNAIDKIYYLIDLFFDIFFEKPELAIVFVNEQTNLSHAKDDLWIRYNELFIEDGEKMLAEGISTGVINPNINVRAFRYFLLGGLRYMLDNWAKDQKALSINVLRQNVKLIIKKGILV